MPKTKRRRPSLTPRRLKMFDTDKRRVQRGDFAMFTPEGNRAVASMVRDIKVRMKGKSLKDKFEAAVDRLDKFPKKFGEAFDTEVRERIFVALATRGQFRDHLEERTA